MELEASEPPHSFIYTDEAGFNLTKRRRRGRNIIDHRATVDVPDQRGGNITMGAAISENGVLTHIPIIGPYNTERLVTFLDTLYRDLSQIGDDLPKYVIVWDNVSFHRSNIIRQWFAAHNRMLMEFLSPYSPFLNPIEEFFSAWRWKVYDRQPHTQMTLLAAMDAACAIGAPPGVGALRKLRTLHIGSGGIDFYRPQYRSYRTDRTARALQRRTSKGQGLVLFCKRGTVSWRVHKETFVER